MGCYLQVHFKSRDMQNMMVGIYRIVHELYIAIFILSK